MITNFFLPSSKPSIFSLPQPLPADAIKERLHCTIIDMYEVWQKELFEIRHPGASSDELTKYLAYHNSPHEGKWAYYPWRNEAIHIPDVDEFREIFFSRNFPIIEKQTQEKLWELQIGSAGLSVGSNIAIELVKAGVHKFKLADYDTLAPSNNNRITGGNIFQIGQNKVTLLAKKLYELNPYCEIAQFPEGLTTDNFKQFVRHCDILIDEIDAFPIKNLLRDYVHSEEGKNTILLQGADLGEAPIVEIESHRDPKFGGRVEDKDIQMILQGNPTKLESTRMLVSVVGRENIPSSFLQNFINIKQGKQTYWAQLGLAATAVGAKITGMVIEIARGNADRLKRLSRLSLREVQNPEEASVNSLFDKEFGYLPPVKGTIFSSDEAMLGINRQSGKRNTLTLQIGDLKITIQEISGKAITDEELSIIHKARHSYKMWGDDLSFLLNDPTDKSWQQGVWETSHLIASVQGPNNFHKVFALKKTYLSHKQLQILAQENNLPLELAVWKIRNAKSRQEHTLWDIFNDWIKNNQSSGNIVTATRFCTISQRKSESEIEKETAAIAFAAMQLFTSDTTPPDAVLNIITKPSLKKVFSVKQGKQTFTPAFDKAEISLGLNTSWKTHLDSNNPIYTYYATKVPKYFAQNPLIYITKTDIWRKSAIELLKAAKEKYG